MNYTAVMSKSTHVVKTLKASEIEILSKIMKSPDLNIIKSLKLYRTFLACSVYADRKSLSKCFSSITNYKSVSLN